MVKEAQPRLDQNQTSQGGGHVEERNESLHLVQAAFELARTLRINRLLVQADELRDVRLVEALRETERIIWVSRDPAASAPGSGTDPLVTIPKAPLKRMSQLQIALFLAVLNRHLEFDESVLCLSGVAGSERLDMLFVTNPRRDFPWFRKRDFEKIGSRHLARIVDITLRFAREGREGLPIGTIFVLGDTDHLSPHLRQLILNPWKGHARQDRDIHNPRILETLREFAAMDGAFVVSNEGIVESAGTYLDAPLEEGVQLAGLGARHAAALALTAVTDAIAVVLSSSSGTVTVFHEGKSVLELEKPRPQG